MFLVALLITQRIGGKHSIWRARQPVQSHSAKSPNPETGTTSVSSVSSTNRPHEPAPLRLSNTAAPLRQLIRSPKAILLENAFFDTSRPLGGVPEHLRSQGDSGAYIVQSRAPPDGAFRRRLEAAGAEIVSYIPNNAYLVHASASFAQQVTADPQVGAVLPYEPYFKLKSPLLEIAVAQEALPEGWQLKVLSFAGAQSAVASAAHGLAWEVIAEEPSPFGPVLTIQRMFGAATVSVTPARILPTLAALPGVQELEVRRSRVFATDLTRPRIGVAVSSTAPGNYLGLIGTNVLVNINDSGVDASHPDLTNRVLSDLPINSVDTNGHGTHVAGIIAGSGQKSFTVTNSSGSVMPAHPAQFRGMAPAARLFAMAANPEHGPVSDTYLQETAARTNALISNNSWHYGDDSSYDLAAARYDAAVRDALPGVTGSQPLLFVFSAGNAGNGDDDGLGGDPDSIRSPGTAKNVITVGAIEQMRKITNQVWACSTVDATNVCVTNAPWYGLTDTNNDVAAFSSRGNVGIGTEGDFGRFKPDVVAPGTFVISARSAQWNQGAYYATTNPLTDYSTVLSNLNRAIGPYYRYESGTSMSAADVSGTLALMQEFFARLGRTNSPALMKALLVNGARGLGAPYDFSINQITNAQGWGLINLSNSVPKTLTNLSSVSGPSLLFDQSPAEALATGQTRTRFISVADDATNQPLRFTLVWTDPPGNPVASIKLVNNLDLIVTNLTTGEVFFGNAFAPGNPFVAAWDGNEPPNLDLVNNVENVFLAPSPGADYSVTVIGRNVNVNAVTAQTNGVVQDYALVIASDDNDNPAALTMIGDSNAATNVASVITLTNGFVSLPGISGSLVMKERVGANSPWQNTNPIPLPAGTNGVLTSGQTNQWRFYVLTNDQNYTNAAFVTFRPPALAVTQDDIAGTNRVATQCEQADVDLYVSTDPALTWLDPAALAAADKSVHRGGTEMITYTNAQPGAYYIGVKVESQQAAEFAFMGVFSSSPFGTQDSSGVWTLKGINLPAVIPDASGTSHTSETNILALAPQPVPVRRVVVTNEVAHEDFSQLVGTLSHDGKYATLNNDTVPPGDPTPNDYTFIYEDNGEGDIPDSQPTAGPGSLRNFAGGQGQGVWLLTMKNTGLASTGRVENLSIRLDPQNIGGAPRDVSTNAFTFDFIDVPMGATNLTVCCENTSEIALPVALYLRSGNFPNLTNYDQMAPVTSGSACLSIDLTSLPPVSPGRYFIGVFNSNSMVQTIALEATVSGDPTNALSASYLASPVMIIPDAVTNASVFVTNQLPVAAVEVEVHLDDPQISDMTLTLISPGGTRVVLFQNRGGMTTNGLGGFPLSTNVFPTRTSGDFNANTNVLPVGHGAGTLYVNYEFYALPDSMRVYYDDAPIFDSGEVNGGGTFMIPYGPGSSTNVTIVMNEGNNENTNTLWGYTATDVSPVSGSVVFTEDTNLARVPIKFAPAPFISTGTNSQLFYKPEQSLDAFAGEQAAGEWRLEMRNVGGLVVGPPTRLSRWQLHLVFQNVVPLPVNLLSGSPGTNAIPPGEIAYFEVNVPVWASFATNTLISASGPVNLLFNPTNPPTGTNDGDALLLSGTTAGSAVVGRTGSPSFIPGGRYFLGVQNTNAFPVTASLEMEFDIFVTPLTNGIAFAANNAGGPNTTDYYIYTVSTNAVRAQFEIENPTDDMTLVARNGFPAATLQDYQFISANPAANDELIVVFKNSTPIPLTPGDWYVSAVNVSGLPVAYSIRATEFPVYGTNVIVTDFAYSTDAFCLTWTSLPGVNYYVQGRTDLNATNWVTVSPTVTADDVLASWCVPLPSAYHFFRVHEGLAVTPFVPQISIESITCRTNGMMLQWTAPLNLHFAVQYSPTLSPAAWMPFTNVITSTNGACSFFDDGTQCGGLSGPRYYRLQLTP